MVSYQLAPEQQDLRDSVAQFARDVIAPVIGGYYERGEFPYDIVAKMGGLGLFGVPFPEEYGGMGGDYFALCLALEELARADSSVAITLEAAVSLGAMPIYRFGTEEQKRQWLPDLLAGRTLGAFGLTEPGGGTATGLAQACVDESVKYAKERPAFGAPIGKNQAIAFKVADMEVRTHTARLAWYRAAELMPRGEPFKKEAAIAKLHSSEIAVTNAR